MKKVVGDIFKVVQPGDVLVHGCNCFHTMGAGIAKQVKRRYPEAYTEDLKTVYGDTFKLGSYSVYEGDVTIVNAYTQFSYSNGFNVDYTAIRKVFKKIKKDFGNKRIFYPKIGAGLGGGDWNKIEKIIDEELEGCDHTLVIWECER